MIDWFFGCRLGPVWVIFALTWGVASLKSVHSPSVIAESSGVRKATVNAFSLGWSSVALNFSRLICSGCFTWNKS